MSGEPSSAANATVHRVPIDVRGHAPRDARVHVYSWAHPSPRATIVIAHGAGEHGMRYAPTADRFITAGCSVVAFDNLGHGRTGLDADGLGHVGPGENRAAMACLEGVLELVHAQVPDVPVVLYGHSWGSLLGQQVIASRPDLVDGVIFSGTALAVPSFLNPGDLDASWRPDPTGLQWLSRDPATIEAALADPLFFDIGERPVWSPIGALQLVHLPPSALRARLDDLPVLILAGSEDPVGYGRRGATALARLYRRRTALSDVTLRVFEGARHELVNELNRDEVHGIMIEWIRARFAPATARPDRENGGDA